MNDRTLNSAVLQGGARDRFRRIDSPLVEACRRWRFESSVAKRGLLVPGQGRRQRAVAI